MMKIRTAITVMSPIMSKDKKAFLIYSASIWTFCQRLFRLIETVPKFSEKSIKKQN